MKEIVREAFRTFALAVRAALSRLVPVALRAASLSAVLLFSADTVVTAAEIDEQLSTAVASYLDHAKTVGQKHVDVMKTKLEADDLDHMVYYSLNYDFPYVFYQLSDVLDEPAWFDVAVDVGKAVSVGYTNPPGYYNYNSGYTVLSQDPRVSEEDREILAKGAENFAFTAAYSNIYPPRTGRRNNLSREIALAVASHLNAKLIGVGPSTKVPDPDALIFTYKDFMLGHVDQWLNEYGPESRLNWAPFMMGLTSRSLIMYYDQMATEDEQTMIEEKLGLLSSRIWDKAWVEEDQAFLYRPREQGNERGHPDLNLLVAPLYGWLYHQTEGPQYAERFDKAFIGGVESAWLGGGKQFNQNYLWSLDGLRWRGVDLPNQDDQGDGVGILRAGDANQDLRFDQIDLVQVQIAGKYNTGAPATWGEGDWNGAPGGSPGNPPLGDGVFDELDIVAALEAIDPTTDPFAALRSTGVVGEKRTSVGYNANTGEVWVDLPAGMALTSVKIRSAAGVFTGNPGQGLTGSFDLDTDGKVFKATFGGSFGTTNFGMIAPAGLSESFVLSDLTASGTVAGGGMLGDVDLIYVAVPEPSTLPILLIGYFGVFLYWRRKR